MSGKKTAGKKKGDSKCEIIENGIEKENVPVIVDDNSVQVNCAKPPQPESKCPATNSSRSVKRRFSFGKGKKKNYDGCANGNKKNGGIRRSHSLSLFNKQDGQSRLPMFRQKNESKNSKKHGSSSRLQIPSNFESRSLVLNPGMDSWRMAGLMDTVGKMNSDMAINSLQMQSPDELLGFTLPPDDEVLSNNEEVVTIGQVLNAGLQDFEVNERICTTETTQTTTIAATTTTIAIACDENTSTPETPDENIKSKKTSNSSDNNMSTEMTASQLLNDKVDELANILTVLANDYVAEPTIESGTVAEVNAVPPSDIVERLQLEDGVVTQSIPSNVPLDSSMSKDVGSRDVYAVSSVTVGSPVSCFEMIAPGHRVAGSDGGCIVASTPEFYNSDGGHEYTIIQELYELDSDHTVSVRKLQDLVIETQIQMPKAVCCDDWLVLDFSNGDVGS